VAGDDNVGAEPCGSFAKGDHVALQIVPQLLLGQVGESLDLEPFVLVDHEHRKERSDVRTEKDGSTGTTRERATPRELHQSGEP
jgi:hypothetical protein